MDTAPISSKSWVANLVGDVGEGGTLNHEPSSSLFIDYELNAFNADGSINPNSFIGHFGITPEELEEMGFNKDPSTLSKEEFLSWHSQLQLAYIYRHVVNSNGTLKDNGILTIGPSDSDNAIHVTFAPLLFQDPPNANKVDPSNPGKAAKVVFINSLTIETIGLIPDADIERMTGDSRFKEVVDALGLETSFGTLTADGNSPIAKLDQLQSVLDDLSTVNSLLGLAALTTSYAFQPGKLDALNAVHNLKLLELSGSSSAQKNAQMALEALESQTDTLIGQVKAGGVFSPEQINTAAQEILDSANVLNTFAKSVREINVDRNAPNPLIGGSINAESKSAQQASLAASFGNLARAEAAKAQALEASNRLLDGTATNLRGRPLDGPGLLSAFVFNLSLKLQARNQFDTERFNQLNTLIKSYGVMQRLINETLDNFGDDDIKTRSLGGSDTEENLSTLNSLSAEEKAAISMFATRAQSGNPLVANPIETLEGVQRPDLDLIDYEDGKVKEFTREQWTTMLQQLNDAVTLLNQNSQIQFNEITTRSQQRTVFFEAASDALTKIDDILASINRNFA